MLILRKVAITGGLCCGKSTVSKLFQKKGAYVVSADAIVHQLLTAEGPIKNQLISLLGEEVMRDSQLDRAVIAKKVFSNEKTLKALESILHPAVLEEIENQYNQVQNQKKHALFIAEIPLLYEIEKAPFFHAVIVVAADPKIAQKRFQEKTKYPAEEFEKRMAHQLPLAKKVAQADYTITNNGNLEELQNQVNTIYQQLTQEENERRTF